MNKDYFSHDSSIIDDGAKIGSGTKIWHFVHISSRAQIGKNCSLGQNVYVGNNTIIGDNVKIQNNVSVYDNVFIEDDVFCGPSVVFTNVYNPRSFVERKNEYRSTFIKKGSSLGANSTIVCGVTIGEYAFVGAGAMVNKPVKAFALVVGVPALQIGWMSKFGERINLPLQGTGHYRCSKTNDLYNLNGETLTLDS
jgi:UDP-2-acetamido-3-amino-2,3-dideoxy-glucuronate N-acetyltransferase